VDYEEHMTVLHVDFFKRKCGDCQTNVYHLVNSLYHGEFFYHNLTLASQVHWNDFLGSLPERVVIKLNVIKENGFLNFT
jgi:hypothetical protein